MKTTTKVLGYFKECDETVNVSLGYMYCTFMRDWLFSAIENYQEADKYVFHFSHEQLHKLDVIRDRKIIKTFSREDWVSPAVDLDSRSAASANDFCTEYLAISVLVLIQFLHLQNRDL